MSNRDLCACRRPPFQADDFESRGLGDDPTCPNLATVSIEHCRHCGQDWLWYLIEQPEHTASGRWWLVPIDAPTAASMVASEARHYVERQVEGFVGGSYFGGRIHALVPPVQVR